MLNPVSFKNTLYHHEMLIKNVIRQNLSLLVRLEFDRFSNIDIV